MALYQNKYRTKTTRLQHWNYNRHAAYFITICTNDLFSFFGKIVADKMQLSEIGQIVANEWEKTPHIRPDMNLTLGNFVADKMQLSEIGQIVANEWEKTPHIRPDMNLTLGNFVVMPNHFHAILLIGANEYNTAYIEDTVDVPYQNQFVVQSKNLGSIMRGFKSAVTVQARHINPDFAWQILYHEHIIRDEESYERISNYIQNNPSLWEKDKFYNL